MDSLTRVNLGRQVAVPDSTAACKLDSHAVVLFCGRERVKPALAEFIKFSLTSHLSRALAALINFLWPLRGTGRPFFQMIHMTQADESIQGHIYLPKCMFCQHLALHVTEVMCFQMCMQSRPIPGGFHCRHAS